MSSFCVEELVELSYSSIASASCRVLPQVGAGECGVTVESLDQSFEKRSERAGEARCSFKEVAVDVL
jgi:hypothetical protein